MRTSQFYFATLKEAPVHAELISHRLMIRAGLIRRLGSGLYTWMPLGLRILRKIENIIREEMNRAGAQELLMPLVQPADLWKTSARWDAFGPQMLRLKDRHGNDFCLGPTHEEVITDIVRNEIRSYKRLPINFYQIQTKFRDEIRPRFGVMRSREFIMKDAYSFDMDIKGMQHSYTTMYDTYSRIFTRLGLRFRAVAADTGAIGGAVSHEFHVLADSGEDVIAFCPTSDFAANIELAEALPDETHRPAALESMQIIATPGQKSCSDVAHFLGVPIQRTVKTLVLMGEKKLHMLILRGDHRFNEVKASKIATLGAFRFATDDEIMDAVGSKAGYLGPVGIPDDIICIVDRSVAVLADFICGANKEGYHLTGVNFGRDLPEPIVADIRDVVEGDTSPDHLGKLQLCRGIEIGHVFQLGRKYAASLNANFIDSAGKPQLFEMGCYGIGVSRIVAAAIEQNYDDQGIIFPSALAPFTIAIVPIGYYEDQAVRKQADALYTELQAYGFDVLLDDRNERPGVLFADIDLIGIPHRITLGKKSLAQNQVEYRSRVEAKTIAIKLPDIISHIQQTII